MAKHWEFCGRFFVLDSLAGNRQRAIFRPECQNILNNGLCEPGENVRFQMATLPAAILCQGVSQRGKAQEGRADIATLISRLTVCIG